MERYNKSNISYYKLNAMPIKTAYLQPVYKIFAKKFLIKAFLIKSILCVNTMSEVNLCYIKIIKLI